MNNVLFGYNSVNFNKLIDINANIVSGTVIDRIESRNMVYKTKSAQSLNKRIKKVYHIQMKSESKTQKRR